jgi:ubiquinone/menaquinone biosynthesis C-methylase UbiE
MDIKEYNVQTKSEKQNHPWEYARLNVVRRILTKFMGGGLNFADIGCGDGFFATELSKHWAEGCFYAVDTAFTPETIAALEAKYRNHNVKFCNNSSEIRLPSGKLNIIFLMDVIEHIENDVEFLSSLRQIAGFGSQTRVVITVPAFQSLYCSHDKWLGHYRRYSKKMLQKHVAQAGFAPLDSGYFFTSLLFPRLLKVLKERLCGYHEQNVSGIGSWNGGKTLTWLVKNALYVDYKISHLLTKVGLKLPGLSCWCVCKIATE